MTKTKKVKSPRTKRPRLHSMNRPKLRTDQSDWSGTGVQIRSPFGEYFRFLDKIDEGAKYTNEYGSVLILSLVEEIGEMARAYLAEHGRKKTNIAAQLDETYQQELGDILVAILRFARIKNINLHKKIIYSLRKIERRKKSPKKK